MDTYSGGIAGAFIANNGGEVICKSCWSTGSIGNGAGGIFGYYSGVNTGVIRAINYYSTGAMVIGAAGGIFGFISFFTPYNIVEGLS